MTDQDIPTIASVKQSMQRHIYDLTTSLAIARAATEGRLPEAYTDQEEAINLMIKQAHVFSNELVGELANMDDLEKLGAYQAQDAAVSGPSVNIDEACDLIKRQTTVIYEARSVLTLITEGDPDDNVHLENAALVVNKLLMEVAQVLDNVEYQLRETGKMEVQS